jgi:hypothetical protein
MNSLSMKYEPIMINFNIPKNLKYHLDRLSKFKGVSRTSILNRLIEEWVRSETKQLEDDGRIYELMSKLEGTIERSILRTVTPNSPQNGSWEKSYEDESLPLPIFSSNEDRW